MNFSKLATELCRRERGKKQINIADASESLARLRDMLHENAEQVLAALGMEVRSIIVFAPKKRKPK